MASLHTKENIIDYVRKKTKEIISVNKTRKTELLQRHLKIMKDEQDLLRKPRINDIKRSMVLLIFYTQMACGQQRKEWTRNWEK